MSSRIKFNRHLLHPWADLPSLGEDEGTPLITRGEGVYVYDDQGRKFLDGPGGMWCMQVGYGRKEIADAISTQALDLSYASAFSVMHPKEIELATRIAEVTPGDLNRIFFTTGGSTAVDSALRLCQLANNIKGQQNRKHILCREQGYHGSTFLAASVTGKERDKSLMDTEKDLVHFLTSPLLSADPLKRSEQDFCDFLMEELDQAILEIGPENIMCFIAEPVLGSGGVVVPPKDYNRRTWELVKGYGIIYIADEVVTGFGRLGHWFASKEVFGIQPDIIICAKGLTSGYSPMGAAIFSERLMDDVTGPKGRGATFSNGYTYSGHPVSAAAGLASMQIIERENILDHVRSVTPLFQERLRDLSSLPLVVDARGMGLMGCVQCSYERDKNSSLENDYELGALIDAECQKNGLVLRPIINMCVMSPPLVISDGQINQMFDILGRAIKTVATSKAL
ncbi:MAG: aminotransferase [Halieaceae bacterium]|nr:aminotransferase [Halieaceae bacterium]